jgi:hypothetical protein
MRWKKQQQQHHEETAATTPSGKETADDNALCNVPGSRENSNTLHPQFKRLSCNDLRRNETQKRLVNSITLTHSEWQTTQQPYSHRPNFSTLRTESHPPVSFFFPPFLFTFFFFSVFTAVPADSKLTSRTSLQWQTLSAEQSFPGVENVSDVGNAEGKKNSRASVAIVIALEPKNSAIDTSYLKMNPFRNIIKQYILWQRERAGP